MASALQQQLVDRGVPPQQARLIAKGVRLGRTREVAAVSEVPGLRSIRRNFFQGGLTSSSFRRYHDLVNRELRRVNPEELAFADLPDWVREQHAAFCYTMYRGHQLRFLDRHEDEDVTEFLNRPNKSALNVTRLVIDTLSKLYHRPPTRSFYKPDDTGEQQIDLEAQTPTYVQDRLQQIWSGKLFNLTMVEVDRYTRLLGTVAIRPIYDREAVGRIRNWVLMSHELRVIPDPERPWRPAVVIERTRPFSREAGKCLNVWTDLYQVQIEGDEVSVYQHKLGRIPHVFARDALSFNSFFVEGRGRSLCDPNAVLNNDLTDLEEIKQMQGFSVGEVVNPLEDNLRVGPREFFTFRPKDNSVPFGVSFKSPQAPLEQLRRDVEAQIDRILFVNGVPRAAIAAAIDQRQLSGAAIRAAMKPLQDDLDHRARIFEPVEWDLADSMLREVARNEPDFPYQEPGEEFVANSPLGEQVVVLRWSVPAERRPQFDCDYQPLDLPESVRDRTLRDDFEVAQGITTPPEIMRRDNPDRYDTDEEAVAQWQENLALLRQSGFEPLTEPADGPAERLQLAGDTPLLDMFEEAGLVMHDETEEARQLAPPAG